MVDIQNKSIKTWFNRLNCSLGAHKKIVLHFDDRVFKNSILMDKVLNLMRFGVPAPEPLTFVNGVIHILINQLNSKTLTPLSQTQSPSPVLHRNHHKTHLVIFIHCTHKTPTHLSISFPLFQFRSTSFPLPKTSNPQHLSLLLFPKLKSSPLFL